MMESGQLWFEEVNQVIAADYPEIELQHVLADNCAVQLVRQPKQYDVLVTDNLFGDILSDVAAMLTGSLGMLPSPRSVRRMVKPPRAGVLNPCTARHLILPVRARLTPLPRS